MPAAGIRAVGRAVPRLRLDAREPAEAWGASPARGIEELAVSAFDEDAVTLAVEAASAALRAAGVDGADLSVVALATTSLAEAGDATVVAEALGASEARLAATTGASALGLSALVSAFDTATATQAPALAIAADVARGAPGSALELRAGAGAVAFLVSLEGGVRLQRSVAHARDLARRERVEDGFVRGPDVETDTGEARARVVREHGPRAFDFVASGEATTGADGKALEGRHALLSPRALLGHAGAADAALHLAEALATASPGAKGLAVESRGGAALALALEVDRRPAGASSVAHEKARGRRVPYLRALQERGVLLGLLDVAESPMGAYAPFPEFADALPARYRLVAARCAACGRVAYPPRAACPACAGRAFVDTPLGGRATLESFTVIGRGGAPSEFAPEQAMVGAYVVGLVRFEEGPRLLARLADVAGEAEAEIGMELEPVLRRLYRQEGVVRYGLKFRPRSA